MTNLVVDTDVVSFCFRLDSRYTEFYGPAMLGHRAFISFMTLAELKLGMLKRGWGTDRQSQLMTHVWSRYIFCEASKSMCDIYAAIADASRRAGRNMHVGDAWIAATAIELNCPLVTHNGKDFEHLSDLKLITLKAH